MNVKHLERATSKDQATSAKKISTKDRSADLAGVATIVEDPGSSLGAPGDCLHSAVVAASGAGEPRVT